MSPELSSSLLISSRLISAFHRFSQPVSTLLSSPQLLSTHLVPSHLFSPPLTSSEALPTSPQLISDLVSSSHLISALLSALSNHLTFSLAQNLLQKRISTPKQATPTLFTEKISHKKPLHIASFCTEKLGHTHTQKPLHGVGKTFLHSEAITHSKLAHTKNLLHTEPLTHSKLFKLSQQESFTHSNFLLKAHFTHTESFHAQQSFTHRIFYTQQTFTHSKLAHTHTQQAFTQRIFYTQNPFTHSKLLHTANLHTQPAFTQKSSCTQKPLHREARTQSSMYTEELLHTEAFTHTEA